MAQGAGRSTARRRGAGIAAVCAASLLVAGCVGSSGAGSEGGTPSSPTAPGRSSIPSAPQIPSTPQTQSAPSTPGPGAAPPESRPAADYAVDLTPADAASGVNPAAGATVSVSGATLEAVDVRPSAGGTSVDGEFSHDTATWTTTQRLAFDTEYSVDYSVLDAAGQVQRGRSTFTTVEPANEADASMFPLDGSTVGTGQPLEFTFSEPVTNRAAVEQAITVTSSSGQEGAFYWLPDRTGKVSDTVVRYRPETFWAPNSTITVRADLFGVDFGSGMIGNSDTTMTVRTHDTRLAVVDNATKTMKVYLDGTLERTFPVTLGTDEWPSTEGYMVVMENYETTRFTAESIGLHPGDPAYYPPTVVNHASRLSNGGAFVHEALPAAQVALGEVNVSHGCIGMSPEGAEYFYDTFGPGDVVQILGTDYGPMYVEDGFGDWNVPWDQWVGQD